MLFRYTRTSYNTAYTSHAHLRRWLRYVTRGMTSAVVTAPPSPQMVHGGRRAHVRRDELDRIANLSYNLYLFPKRALVVAFNIFLFDFHLSSLFFGWDYHNNQRNTDRYYIDDDKTVYQTHALAG
jgi:hypothetical protein